MESVIKSRPLSEAQLMVLQVINDRYSEEDLKELRQLLLDFNDRKVQEHLDKTVDERGYTDKDFEDMLYAHSRKAHS